MHADGRFRRCQGVAEGQVLKAVQGVVVHEVADRRLCRQHMLEPVQQLVEQGAQTLCVRKRKAGHSGSPRRR